MKLQTNASLAIAPTPTPNFNERFWIREKMCSQARLWYPSSIASSLHARTTTSLITRISWETALIPGAIAQKSTDSRRANNASSVRWLHDRLSNEFASGVFLTVFATPATGAPSRTVYERRRNLLYDFPRQYPRPPRSLIYGNYLVTFEGSTLAGEK